MLADHTLMSVHSARPSTVFQPLPFLLAGAFTALLATAAACSSDSKDDPAKGGASASGASSGGSSSSTAGKGANDAGKASSAGGTVDDGTGGDASPGGAPGDGGGGDAAGAQGDGGSSPGTGGSSSAGSGNGTLPGDDVWNCVAGGTSCICQNNADPNSANTCTGTYPCCFAIPLGASTRCQCQDPYTSKCSDFADAFGGKVVDHCPP